MTRNAYIHLERHLGELFDAEHQAITPSQPEWDESATFAVVALDTQRVGARRRIGVAVIAVAASAAVLAIGLTVVFTVMSGRSGVTTQPRVGGSGPSDAGAAGCTDGTTPATYPCSAPVRWDTPQVHLEGTGFSIITVSQAGAKDFTANDPNISVHSDPGYATYQTLELEWHENGVEQRWYIYFASDGKDWWASQMQTFDGQSTASDGIPFGGQRFRTPLGSAWSGDLDVTASDHGVTSHIRMRIAHLQAFLSHGSSSVSPPTTVR